MARLRHTARKSVIPFLPSRLAERPLHRTVSGQSSHLERLHHRLREEPERQRQQGEHRGAAPHRLYLLLEQERRALLLLLLSSTLLLLVQAVVQPLQVARLTRHWTVKRALCKTRRQERND